MQDIEHAAVSRTTVARMLARQAHDEHNPAQFIVTTFHPQVLICKPQEALCSSFHWLGGRMLHVLELPACLVPAYS
jgi:hypothetical protein